MPALKYAHSEIHMNCRPAWWAALLFFLTTPLWTQNDVHITYNHAVDFTQFRTYAWGEMPKPSQIKNPQLAKVAQDRLNAILSAKGLRMVSLTEKPDLILTAAGAMKEKMLYSDWDASRTVLTAGTDYGTPERELVGALMVDLYDVNAKKLVWRGTAIGVLNQKNIGKNEKLVGNVITKMFEKFPYAPTM
jgi:hypothetical protein